jgi:hypothetical protein
MDSGFNRQSIGLFDHLVGEREQRNEIASSQLVELHSVPRQPGPDCRIPSRLALAWMARKPSLADGINPSWDDCPGG